MPTPQPHEDHLVEEFRELARRKWGGKRAGAGRKPAPQPLVNIDRAARLLSITENPYMRLAFARHSTLDLMRICTWHLMEGGDYNNAGKLLKQIKDFENADAADEAEAPPEAAGQGEPVPSEPSADPPSEPEPEFVLDDEARPVRSPLPSAEETLLRDLSDREVARLVAGSRPLDRQYAQCVAGLGPPAPTGPGQRPGLAVDSFAASEPQLLDGPTARDPRSG